MVTGERKARYDRLGFFTRNDFAIFQWIADDAIVDLGVERALIERDSGSAAPTFGNRLSEAARSLLTLPPVTTPDMPAMLPAIVMSIVTLVVVTRIGACVRLLVGAGIRLLILALVRSLIIWPLVLAFLIAELQRKLRKRTSCAASDQPDSGYRRHKPTHNASPSLRPCKLAGVLAGSPAE